MNMRNAAIACLAFLLIGILSACTQTKENDTNLTLGTTEGIYAQVAEQAILPAMKDLGYNIKLVKYVDLIEPNLQLEEGEIDVNLIQQPIYLEQFKQEYDVSLVTTSAVPSVAYGLYSKQIESIADIPEGAVITIPNDELGTARALQFLQQQQLIELHNEAEPFKVTEQDIVKNDKNLTIQPIIISQMIASLESADLAVIPDNYVIADEEMELSDALAEEQLSDELLYKFAVREEDQDKPFVEDLAKVVQSKEFQNIIKDKFEDFGQ